MHQITALVPSRFLTLIAHLITVITILWSRDSNVQACLPMQYTDSEYQTKDSQLIVGLSLGIALIAFELLSFLVGISMFAPLTSLISIICHTAACVCLFYFVSDAWDCDLYWWIFGFCSVLPMLTEIWVMIRVLAFRKGL